MDSFVALDIGERRVGVAVARTDVRIASPLTTLLSDKDIFDKITTLVAEQHAAGVIVGLPLDMNGQETAQTRAVQQFVAALRPRLKVPMYWQDEALTSLKAEEELRVRGKPFAKGDVDALAATFILEDFLRGTSPEPIA